MFAVGLTGGIGSGKSTVADLFAELGTPVIDTDAIAHQLTGPGGAALGAVHALFGDAVMLADGTLDRAALRRRIFADTAARRQAPRSHLPGDGSCRVPAVFERVTRR